MGVNSLPKTVTRQRRGCDLNLGPSAPESSRCEIALIDFRVLRASVGCRMLSASDLNTRLQRVVAALIVVRVKAVTKLGAELSVGWVDPWVGLQHEPSHQWRRQGGTGEAFPLWVDVQKLCNMCVLSLSWNFFVSHDKYIARPSSKEPR